MQLPKEGAVLRWAWFALAAAAMLWTAHMFRWAAMPGEDFAWDRWRHRLCELAERNAENSAVTDIAVYPRCSVLAGAGEGDLRTVLTP